MFSIGTLLLKFQSTDSFDEIISANRLDIPYVKRFNEKKNVDLLLS